MNTIQDKLSRLAETKEDIRQALISTGIDVPANTKFSEYAVKILEAPCYKFPDLQGDVTRWSFKGLTNVQMSKNPRVEDLDGKGRVLEFKNFAWGGMSGCGGYSNDFSKYGYGNIKQSTYEYSYEKVTLKVPSLSTAGGLLQENIYSKASEIGSIGDVYDFHIKVTGLKSGGKLIVSGGVRDVIVLETTEDGIYHIKTEVGNDWQQFRIYFSIYLGNDPMTVTIEQLPYYPGMIISDGIDDHAVTKENLDFQDTYTVYTAFIPFDDENKNMVLCGKNHLKDFYLNFSSNYQISYYPYKQTSSGLSVLSSSLASGFNLVVCKKQGNKISLKNLTTGEVYDADDADVLTDNPGLYYLWRSATVTAYSKAAIAGQVITNGHFTTDEEDASVLAWFKKEYPWLFFDQAWTVTGKSNNDTNKATVSNLRTGGVNLTLRNFAFKGNSGYGSWPAISFTSGLSANQPYGTLYFGGSTYAITTTGYVGSIKFKFRLRELPDGGKFIIRGYSQDSPNSNAVVEETYDANGIYEFSYNDSSIPVALVFYSGASAQTMSKFYIDIIPEYEGYLVTDGVDDWVSSPSFGLSGKYTVIGEWKILADTYITAGIVHSSTFFIYSYYKNNVEGLSVYINRGTDATFFPFKSIKAFNSDGFLYDKDWNQYVDEKRMPGKAVTNALLIGGSSTINTTLIFKNLAIYSKNLSKEDCIKAYIYLQTLKSK